MRVASIFNRTFACSLALAIALPAAAAAAGSGTDVGTPAAAEHYGPLYANLQGEVVLDNARVFVQKFIVPPGQFTGRRTKPGDQLQVFIKGGLLTSKAGRSTQWSWVTLKK